MLALDTSYHPGTYLFLALICSWARYMIFYFMKPLNFIVAQLVLVFCVLLGSNAWAVPRVIGNNTQAFPLLGEELDVGVAIAPPFVIADRGFNNLSGIDIELIYELQRRTGFSFTEDRIQLMNFGELLDIGEEGQLDITGGAISLTQERSTIFDLSESSCLSDSVAVVRNGSNITNVYDLLGRTIAVEVGTTAEEVLPTEIAQGVKIKHSATNFMQFYDVARGDADVMIVDHAVAVDYIKTWPDANLKVAFTIPQSEGAIGLLFKKNPRVAKHLAQAFKEMKEDGTVDEIVNRYIPNYTAHSHKTTRLAQAKWK